MNTFHRLGIVVAIVAPAVLLVPFLPAQAPVADETFIEIQTRGPVHEAFAQPQDLSQPGAVVPKEPPPPLPESAPDVRPEGDDIQWIPGYWAWDAERNEFLWISGTYRDAPPGRNYVAGYWEQTQEGWRWVNGFWAPTDQPLPYVPQPPASLEIGPTGPPPGDNYIYTPGYWLYRDTRFAWQPGAYLYCHPGFVWTPPRYVWTPAGYLFFNRYADYCLERRGLLFASAAFHRPLWRTPGWTWRPNYVVGCGSLLDSLFIDVRFGHYRYGDYYGNRYVNAGIQPWHAYAGKRYDPLFAQYQWENRKNPAWQTGLVKRYDDRISGAAPRPPQSLYQQALVVNQTNNVNLKVAQPVTQFVDPGVKLAKVSAQQQTQQQLAIKHAQEVNQHRLKTEAALAKQPPTALKAGAAQALILPPGPAGPKFEPKVVQSQIGAKGGAVIQTPPPGPKLPKIDNKQPVPLIKQATPPPPPPKAPPPAPKSPPPPPKSPNKKLQPEPTLPKVESKLPGQGPTITAPPSVKQIAPPPVKQATPPPAAKQIAPPPVKQATPPPAAKQIAPPPVKQATPPPAAKQIAPPPTTVTPPAAKQVAPSPVKQAIPPPAAKQVAPPPVKQATPPPAVKQATPPPAAKQIAPPPVKQATPPPKVIQKANPAPVAKTPPPAPRMITSPPPPPPRIQAPPPPRQAAPAPPKGGGAKGGKKK